jgi:uncharacterized membrane protein (UPF0127 family)
MKEKTRLPLLIITLVLVLAGISLWLGKRNSGSDENIATTENFTVAATSQKIEGQLLFINKDNADQVKRIAIEVADTPEERNRGLMDRRSLPDTTGMLFIFERSGPQNFWMKNTYIPLDIIFVNAEKQIVKIHKYATPHSIDSYPSEKDAQYVVEVNGGFTDQHNIKEGDRISFSLPNRNS